jgi:predicted Zn-dependent protease
MIAALALCVLPPVAAQSLSDLDALSDKTASEASGLALAQQQTERGELLEALATLERVMALFPKSREARFNHAMLLCWVGDPQGAEVEFSRLSEKDYEAGVLQRARAECRPRAAQGS